MLRRYAGFGESTLLAKARSRPAAGEPARQYAALPVRIADDGGLEIMLVTSRGTRRWIIPKGWPMPHRAPGETAAREAFEEAGLVGDLQDDGPAGTYTYRKRLQSGRSITVEVDVFVLRVSRQRRRWPERAQRTTRWYDPATASSLVQEPDLAELILRIGHDTGDGPQADRPVD